MQKDKTNLMLMSLLISLSLLSGCAHNLTLEAANTLPERVNARELPEQFSAQAQDNLRENADRSTETNDDFAATEKNITQSIAALHEQFVLSPENEQELSTLIQASLANNPNLAVTGSFIKDAILAAEISSRSRYPNLGLGLNANRSKSVFQPNQVFTFNNFSLGLNSQWELDLWGRINNQTKADYSIALATKQDFRFAQLSLAANTARSYFNLVTEKEVLTLRKQSNANTQQIEKITERSFKRGLVTALDVQQARRDLAATKQRELDQANTVSNASRSVSVLAGEYPDRDAYTTQFSNTQLPLKLAPLHPGIPANALAKRPDIQAALARIQAAEFDSKAARRALLPSISLTGNAGTNANELADLLDTDFSVWSLIGSLSYPLLNRKSLSNSIKLADNDLARQIDNFDALLLSALQEIEAGLDTENSLIKQVSALQEARDYAQQSARRAKTQYESGLVNANTLLNTQSLFYSAEENLLRTRNALLQNRINLYIALGGHFSVQNND